MEISCCPPLEISPLPAEENDTISQYSDPMREINNSAVKSHENRKHSGASNSKLCGVIFSNDDVEQILLFQDRHQLIQKHTLCLLNIKGSKMTIFMVICAKDALNVIPQGYFSFTTLILSSTTYQPTYISRSSG